MSPGHAQVRTSVNRESGRLAALRARALAFLLYPVASVRLASIFGSFVEWCGHQQEVTLVPEGPLVGYGIDGWALRSVLSALGILFSIAFAFLLLPLALSPADRLRA